MYDLEQRLEDALRASGRRLTPQRRLILQVLAEGDRHLDADALCDRAKLRDPSISLATVYRTMAVLKELGLVEEHHLGQERGYYETVHDNPHYHFTCLYCGKVIEFDTPLIARMEQELCEREGIGVFHTYLHMSGHCGRCRGAEDPAAAPS